VLVVDPRRKAATLHRSDNTVLTFRDSDRLSVPDLVPGWSMSIAEIFR
jgi:hypothetical protein